MGTQVGVREDPLRATGEMVGIKDGEKVVAGGRAGTTRIMGTKGEGKDMVNKAGKED